MYKPTSMLLSGPAFSFLLYENTKASFMQEGFLLGEVVHKEKRTITDNDQQQIMSSTTIKVNSVVPCPMNHYFYDSVGKVDRRKIEEFLGAQFERVVAWYQYKKVANFQLSLRHKIIHKQLSEVFNISPELFTTCLLITEASENCSTHSYQQAFFRFNNYMYDRVPVHITNLSENNNTYKCSEASSETFSRLLSGLKVDINKSQGLDVINKIHQALQDHTDSVVKELTAAEKRLYELETEVQQLSQAKKAKELWTENQSSNLDKSGEIMKNTKTLSNRGRGKRKAITSNDRNGSPVNNVDQSRTRRTIL
ncbi:unnamed protein product [Brassicogethes aeneus]|uniref:BRISC complex subunit FAM175B helical domain-containing protein n=1 Tax=Brassicogethes aeneus TaxID=1431903 RepID=A0A9P0FDU3_BRAAE|nr:unnamed protein product [Brassicogethes aeneus]